MGRRALEYIKPAGGRNLRFDSAPSRRPERDVLNASLAKRNASGEQRRKGDAFDANVSSRIEREASPCK